MLDALQEQYKNTTLHLLEYILSDEELEATSIDSDSDVQQSSLLLISSPISSSRSISPFSDGSVLHICDGSLVLQFSAKQLTLATTRL